MNLIKKNRVLIFIVLIGISVVILWQYSLAFLRKTDQGFNHAHLDEIRQAISRYKKDDGSWPKNLKDLIPKYLSDIPKTVLIGNGHLNSTQVEYCPFLDSTGKVDLSKLKDTGHWLYDPSTGKITIDCTHKSFLGFSYYDIGWKVGNNWN